MTDGHEGQHRRRRVLELVAGGLIGVSGCASDGDSETSSDGDSETSSDGDSETSSDGLVSGTVDVVSSNTNFGDTLSRRYHPNSGLPESPSGVESVTNISNEYSLTSAPSYPRGTLLFTSNAQGYHTKSPTYQDETFIESFSPANSNFSKSVEVGDGDKLPPHYHDGRFYVLNDEGDVRVLDATTGERQDLYAISLDVRTTVFTPITMANGTLYYSAGAELVAYDLIDQSVLYRIPTDTIVEIGTVTSDGRLYGIGDDGGGVYFLSGYDITAGEQLFTARYPSGFLNRVVELNGTLCVYSSTGIKVVNKDSGETRLDINFETIDVGSDNDRLVVGDQRLYYGEAKNGEIAALDITSGEELWRTLTPTTPQGGFTLANGVLYVGGKGAILYAYDATTGDLLVEHELPIDGDDLSLEGLLPVGDGLFGLVNTGEFVRIQLS